MRAGRTVLVVPPRSGRVEDPEDPFKAGKDFVPARGEGQGMRRGQLVHVVVCTVRRPQTARVRVPQVDRMVPTAGQEAGAGRIGSDVHPRIPGLVVDGFPLGAGQAGRPFREGGEGGRGREGEGGPGEEEVVWKLKDTEDVVFGRREEAGAVGGKTYGLDDALVCARVASGRRESCAIAMERLESLAYDQRTRGIIKIYVTRRWTLPCTNRYGTGRLRTGRCVIDAAFGGHWG
jgi:hypothetical protein